MTVTDGYGVDDEEIIAHTANVEAVLSRPS